MTAPDTAPPTSPRPKGDQKEAHTPPPRWVRSPLDEPSSLRAAPAVATVFDWVETNQQTAMLAAFAVGVFVGVLMRR